MIEHISLVVDGEQISIFDSDLLLLLHKTYDSINHRRGINILVGNIPELYEISECSRGSIRLYIQIPFFFGRDYGNSLTLVNMLYSETEIKLKLRSLDELLYLEPGAELAKPVVFEANILGNYIYLSEEERKSCATLKTDALMERYIAAGPYYRTFTDLLYNVPTNPRPINNVLKFMYNFADCCKYLIWRVQVVDPDARDIDKIYWDLPGYRVRNSDGIIDERFRGTNIIKNVIIEFNGQIREQIKDGDFYTYLTPYNTYMNGNLDSGEGLYSMCLFPKRLQPSGATNLSKIADVSFYFQMSDEIVHLMKTAGFQVKVTMWACSYNIFAAISGFGALRFYGTH